MNTADIRLGQHVQFVLVLGAAIPPGYGVLGWHILRDADERFNGAAATAHPYINLLPHLCGHVVRGCPSLYSSTGDTHEAI